MLIVRLAVSDFDRIAFGGQRTAVERKEGFGMGVAVSAAQV